MCLKPKYKSHMNFYECCDLTKKVCLTIAYTCMYLSVSRYLFWDECRIYFTFCSIREFKRFQKCQVLYTKQTQKKDYLIIFSKIFYETLVLALPPISKSIFEIYSYTSHICNQYCQKYISQRVAIKAGVPEIEL